MDVDRYTPSVIEEGDEEDVPYADEVANLPQFDDEESDDDDEQVVEIDPELLSEGCQVCHPEDNVETEAKHTTDAKTTWTDQVKMIHLRRYIDQLTETIKDKDYLVNKTREELKKCKETLEALRKEKEVVQFQIREHESTNNVAGVDRLKANYHRINQEIDDEEKLCRKIQEKLDHAEYELSGAQVEQGKYLLQEDELIKKEGKLLREKTDQANYRNRKENRYAENMLYNDMRAKREKTDQAMERQHSMKAAVEDAKRSLGTHQPHLHKTIAKMKQREKEEEKRQKEHLQRRMDTMLALKNDISANRENFRAILAKNATIAEEKKQEEAMLIEKIRQEGGNPDLEILKQQRLQQMEQEKQKFLYKKRENELKIAKKLVVEQELMERKKKLNPMLFPPAKTLETKTTLEKLQETDHDKHPKLFDMLEGYQKKDDGGFPVDQSLYDKTGDESDEEEMAKLMAGSGAQFFDAVDNLPDTDDEQDEGNDDMLVLDFEGGWNEKNIEKNQKNFYNAKNKNKAMTKMDKEIFDKRMDLHRGNLTQTQKVAGREFKGKQPFSSKPEVVHFKDFVVGETYTQRVVFTNVTYSINYLKLIDLTENLRDFIDVDFKPPGQLSAGLTCEMVVTFKPMINADLAGGVNLVAQTGPFFLEILCTTKKVKLAVSTHHMEFGTTVIGETLKRTVTLTNSGALPTSFQFMKASDMQPKAAMTITSLGGAVSQRSVTTEEGLDEFEASLENKKKLELEPNPSGTADKGKPGSKNKIEASPEELKKEGSTILQRQVTNVSVKGSLNEGVDTKEKGTEEEEDEKEEDEADAGGSSVEFEHMEDLADMDGMKISSEITSGEIAAFGSVTMEVIWQPTIPGRTDNEFVFSFGHPSCENITITASGNAIDVPVWVPRPTIDLKICMYDRLYQDTITVNNRASTALRLTFEVCPELRNHLELLPRTGYIQAQSQFSAQLKFLPKQSLAAEAGKYFDKETGVLEAPLTIRVADQTKPVHFTMHAVVTSTDIVYDLKQIDFGHCTIYESVVKKIKITNKSILPQQFGFTDIPDYVDVQPDDGFGTLLPLETLEYDIVFSPPRAGEYKFTILLKSLIGREFKLQCRGVAVHSPLKLEKQIVYLQATALNDLHITYVNLVNAHTNMNEFKQPVPRIGSGEIAPVGPTSFEFVIPEDAPFSIFPKVGTIKPGKKKRIQLRYTPHINEKVIKSKAVEMVTLRLKKEAEEEQKRQLILEEQRKKEEASKAAEKAKKGAKDAKGKNSSPSPSKPDYGPVVNVKEPPPIEPPDPENISKDSNDYALAHTSLQLSFNGEFSKYVVPCYVASGSCGKAGELPYNIHNTLYLEVLCPARKPDMVLMSDCGRHVVDFGDISVGQRVSKFLSIQNATEKPMKFKSTLLDLTGPFEIRNAVRAALPYDSTQILVAFNPTKAGMYQENLKVSCPTSDLYLKIRGHAVKPLVTLSVPDGVYDMGCVLVGEYREEVFRIQNTSTLSVQYNIRMDTYDNEEYNRRQQVPQFISKKDDEHFYKSKIGVQNYCGAQVFDAVPRRGIIAAGATAEITVTFAPDHQSDKYSDGMHIDLFGKPDQHVFHLIGKAKPSVMYMRGGEDIEEYTETLMPPNGWRSSLDASVIPPPKAMVVHLYSINKSFEFSTATKDIFVGCVRTMAVSQKKENNAKGAKGAGGAKQGEFQFDDLKSIQPMGFTIDPVKGWIEAGTEKTLTVNWTPNFDADPAKTVEVVINCNLRGDFSEVQRIILRGFIVSPAGFTKMMTDEAEKEARRPKSQKEIEELELKRRELVEQESKEKNKQEDDMSDIEVQLVDEEGKRDVLKSAAGVRNT